MRDECKHFVFFICTSSSGSLTLSAMLTQWRVYCVGSKCTIGSQQQAVLPSVCMFFTVRVVGGGFVFFFRFSYLVSTLLRWNAIFEFDTRFICCIGRRAAFLPKWKSTFSGFSKKRIWKQEWKPFTLTHAAKVEYVCTRASDYWNAVETAACVFECLRMNWSCWRATWPFQYWLYCIWLSDVGIRSEWNHMVCCSSSATFYFNQIQAGKKSEEKILCFRCWWRFVSSPMNNIMFAATLFRTRRPSVDAMNEFLINQK